VIHFTIAQGTALAVSSDRLTKNEKSNELNKSQVALSPNPVSGVLKVNFNAEDGTDVGVRLLSLEGKTLVQQNLKAVSGNNETSLNVQSFANGIYLLEMDIKGVTTSYKVYVQY